MSTGRYRSGERESDENFFREILKQRNKASIVFPLDTQFYCTDTYASVVSRNIEKQLRSQRGVFDRLTDPQYYTGSHRERFDEFGNGRGLAGREYLRINDGLTESASRCHEVFSTVVRKRKPKRHMYEMFQLCMAHLCAARLPVVEPGTLGTQRFGVQTITPKLMWLYRNGDKHHCGEPFFLRSHLKSLEHAYRSATNVVQPLAGPVRKFYDQDLNPIRALEEIVDGAKYLCTSGEPPAPISRLEKFLSHWVVHPM